MPSQPSLESSNLDLVMVRGFKIVRLTIKKRMRTTLMAIRETLMRRRHEPIAVVGRWLRQVLQGYLNYHAVPDNLIPTSANQNRCAQSRIPIDMIFHG